MAQMAAGHYSEADRAEVTAAVDGSETWEREDDDLHHRIAMVSLKGNEGSLGTSESPIPIEASSGEDSLLGASAVPHTPVSGDNETTGKVQSMFSLPSSGDNEAPKARSFSSPRTDQLDESSGYAKVKKLFDSDTSDGSVSTGGNADGSVSTPPIRACHAPKYLGDPASATESSSEVLDIGGGIRMTPGEVESMFTEQEFGLEAPAAHAEGSAAEGSSSDRPSIHSAPSRIRVWTESVPSLLGGSSKIAAAVKEAAELGSYMPMAFGDQAVCALYDSGASISQAQPETRLFRSCYRIWKN